MSITDDMRAIQALDPDASLKFSDFTGRWYVSARIEVSTGYVLRGLGSHQPTPNQAVRAYAAEIRAVKSPETVVVDAYKKGRTEWLWSDKKGWVAQPSRVKA